ncbi:MAG: hypothetical protein HOC93_05300 [Phycisphaerae bacterium]|jgi:hypothetical protein|nr:hypothetical protein [Phycisphaerae bacterium]|tara:strand:- start:275 stop:481 length:207 start_codon:yes stop_codon:yes gene_type:complete
MTNKPNSTETQDLIHQATSHELGVDFLINGSLDAVAMTFGVHAFVVDAARDQLSKPEIVTEHREVITA